jgi:hypothetical protein
LIEADAALAALQRRVATSRYLNPTNAVEAHAAFTAGKPVRFTYVPASWADEHLRALDRIRPPQDHPLGREVAAAVHDARLAALALRDRTATAFDRMADHAGWNEESRDPAPTGYALRPFGGEVLPATAIVRALETALRERGLVGWRVELDPLMTARVLADAPRTLLRVNPRASCSAEELGALVAHEVDVHVMRAVNGARQPLQIFRHGLHRSLATEEGLALHAEAAAAGLPEGAADRLRIVALVAARARDGGFTELVREMAARLGRSDAWATVMRVKRGLAEPEKPGAYTKDRVYWIGWRQVGAWLAAGGQREELMVGKVGIQHPVAEWMRQGWVQPLPAEAAK